MIIRFKNWEKFNPSSSKTSSWFRLNSDLPKSAIWDELDSDCFRIFIYMLCQANESPKRGEFVVSMKNLNRICFTTEEKVKNTINVLKQFQIVETKTRSRLGVGSESTLSTIRNDTIRNEGIHTSPDGSLSAERLVEIWNSEVGNLPKCSVLSKKRKKLCLERLNENPSSDYWRAVARRIAASKFCNGGGEKGWRADFDFFIKPDAHIRVMEGKYDETQKKTELSYFAQQILEEEAQKASNQ